MVHKFVGAHRDEGGRVVGHPEAVLEVSTSGAMGFELATHGRDNRGWAGEQDCGKDHGCRGG